jgi:D-methionine transport system substrate-binding protein
MGVFSTKVKTLASLKSGARVGVPNDPTNGGRALLLLQAQGLFKLKAGAGLSATPLDIASNPKKIRIVELDAAQLPRSLADLDAAVINGNYAQQAGLKPATDAIAIEGPTGPYANVIAVRTQDKAQPWVAKLMKAYHSPEVKQFIQKQYQKSVIAAW